MPIVIFQQPKIAGTIARCEAQIRQYLSFSLREVLCNEYLNVRCLRPSMVLHKLNELFDTADLLESCLNRLSLDLEHGVG